MRPERRNRRRSVETAFHAVPDPDAAVVAADKIKPPVRLRFSSMAAMRPRWPIVYLGIPLNQRYTLKNTGFAVMPTI